MLAKLMESVRKALVGKVGKIEERYWFNIITVLYWIQNRGELKQFVRHRVNEILAITLKKKLGHFPGIENPADLRSRVEFAWKIQEQSLWLAGPRWLSSVQREWPQSELGVTEESKEEEKQTALLVVDINEEIGIQNVISIERYGRVRSYSGYGRVISYSG